MRTESGIDNDSFFHFISFFPNTFSGVNASILPPPFTKLSSIPARISALVFILSFGRSSLPFSISPVANVISTGLSCIRFNRHCCCADTMFSFPVAVMFFRHLPQNPPLRFLRSGNAARR